MLNIYEYINQGKVFRKFEVDELLFVEYKCLIEETRTGYWTNNNYFVFVLEGRKRWMSSNESYSLGPNESIFIKKGAYVAHNFTEDDFCALLIFVPDDFIRTAMSKYTGGFNTEDAENLHEESIYRIPVDPSLSGYFLSLLGYFPANSPPTRELLKIKFEELILNVISNPENGSLKSYFQYLQYSTKVSIPHIMEAYYMYNMNLKEYARLCARSLSAFRGEFNTIYGMTPSKWLLKKRLEHARLLVDTTDKPINDVAFESGFRNTSHFIRVFKQAYGNSPQKHRSGVLI